ncbi:hypothetical protein ACFSBT_04640 [Halomarina rubra]|uniref:Uncharacterized protein n=1 Tax=Halomarina rubra TaxID=2071873 RepID=A0ABD6ASG4_9EURY
MPYPRLGAGGTSLPRSSLDRRRQPLLALSVLAFAAPPGALAGHDHTR